MKILLGVTGGIAAYKAAHLVRHFVSRGDEVRVVMTRGAQEFITPMTLQVVSEHRVGTDLFDPTYESEIGHIELARWPDLVLVAPATAQVIAKAAHGFADDLLTTVLLATRAPVCFAPAMNTQMWEHPQVHQNIQRLRDLGAHIIDPDSGLLACKEVGAGRLPDPPLIAQAIDQILAPKPQPLSGKKILITAGPTREHLDPARFLSNPSTGKMGVALAQAALAFGAEVTLVAGPLSVPIPPSLHHVPITTALQMHQQVMDLAPDQDMIIKAAAVCDWRPAEESPKKRPKSEMIGTLQLVRNPDILADLGTLYGPAVPERTGGPILVGFAAESHDLEARGRVKLARKGAHWLVANLIGGPHSAFGADDSSAIVLAHDDHLPPLHLGPAPKLKLASLILHHLWSMS